jgi:hypothetical protein
MVGQKLFDLLNVLSSSQRKSLEYSCIKSDDKRFRVLKELIHWSWSKKEDFSAFLSEKVNEIWPLDSRQERDLKVRRVADFIINQIEKIVLESYLEKNSGMKNLLLARAMENSGQIGLVDRYYQKAVAKSALEEEPFNQLMALQGRIRTSYNAQSIKEVKSTLHLNQELLAILQRSYTQKKAEYYNNASNIYLEKDTLIIDQRGRIISEIMSFLNEVEDGLHKVSLYFSLAKLNFENDEERDAYFAKAIQLLYEIELQNNEYLELERKIRFLELRLSFFTGKSLEVLIPLSHSILKTGAGFSIINNNSLFYYILFLILNGEQQRARQMLEDNNTYFKGNGMVMESFLRAVLFENDNNYKNAIPLLNPIVYHAHYFFAVFARLLLIKIHYRRENKSLCLSLIHSTASFLHQNRGNPLGKEANIFVLNHLKRLVSARQEKKIIENEAISLSVFHKYLISF